MLHTTRQHRLILASVAVLGALTLWGTQGPEALAAASVTHRTPVLGLKGFGIPGATGWGTYKPREIFNGGDPSGHVVAISWQHWGSRTAEGSGKGFIFKPKGGYYPGAVTVALRAFDLGHCRTRGPLAYQRLDVRYPSKPGGSLGKWLPWSGSLCVKGP